MASKIMTSPATGEPKTRNDQPKRPLMPHKLLEAAIGGNEIDLKQLLGLNDEDDHPPDVKVDVDDITPMEPSDCLRSTAGMENTILHILSANGHENLVSTICTKDSSLLKARNGRNETPFHHAARFGHDNTILELSEHADLEFGVAGLKELLRQKNSLGETALHEAARHAHRAIVSMLMVDLELAGLVNDDSVSPLYLATARGSLDVVQNMVATMLNHQITPAFYSGPKQQTALHAAVLQDIELTKELLQLNSKEPLCRKADETGRTPLHFVASTGNHEIAELLLDKDPSLAYIPDSGGSFPLHTAVRMGHVKMIALLLQRCPDSGDLLDGNGRNFLHIAIEANKSDVIFKLLKDSKSKFPISHWEKMFNRIVNTMDNKGNTPLHIAAEHEYIGVMDSLLKNNKLDWTLQNKEGLTAVDISMIKLRQSAGNTQEKFLDEMYIRKRGAPISTGWFQYYTKEQMPKTEDNISEADARGDKKSSESVIAKAQLVGLGSVLIATVTFAAAFTLPGGTNQDTGTPILGRKYCFKAFVLADLFAFSLSIFSTMALIYSSGVENSDWMERVVTRSLKIFTLAARCMVMALALGLYLVLAPIGNTGAVVLAFSVYLIFMSSQYGVRIHFEKFRLKPERIIQRLIAAGRPVSFKEALSSYNSLTIWAPIVSVWAPFFAIFLFAVI